MKTKTTIYKEFEFTVNDLDSGESITDVLLINANVEDNKVIERILSRHIETKHPITTLNGNTWELCGYSETGKLMKQTITQETIQEPTAAKSYPLVTY